MSNPIYIILSALVILITLTLHEYAHGYVAYRLGDDTAKSLGRLSLNPLKHLDPVGAICMLLFHIGWAKPVPINPRNFKNPKRGFAICALAGPLSNIIMAFFSAGLYLLLVKLFAHTSFSSEFLFNLANNLLLFVFLFHSINIGLGIFNLIPVPPLDGSRLLTVILPERAYFKIMKNERKIYLLVVIWLLAGDYAKTALLSIPFIAKNSVLSALAGVLSLSDMLSAVISAFSSGMMWIWQLIPYLK